MTLSVAISLARPGFRLSVAADIPGAGLTALFGPSGAGKSTVLRVVAGLERYAAGRIAFGGTVWQDASVFVPPHLRRVGTVFQDARLFDHLTVAGNLAFAARRAPEDRTAEVVSRLDLGPLLPRKTTDLSGGERQRVAIGRALLTCPRLLVMDEPLSALDGGRRAAILPYLEALRDQIGVPILYVTHAVAEVARLADTILALDGGRVVAFGPAARVMADPAIFAVLGADEVGAMLTARVIGHDPDDGLSELGFAGGRLSVPLIATPPGAMLRLRIRARDILIALTPPAGTSALNILPVTVVRTVPEAGGACLLTLDCGGEALLARITQRSARTLGIVPGLACHAVIKSVAVVSPAG